MNYESPIHIAYQKLTEDFGRIMENDIMEVVHRYGIEIEVDKDELIKALKYDRGQYMKGYQDGLIGGGYNTKQLYLIVNQGCDAETYGLAWIRDSEFARFKDIIDNLNKNSHYGCMPTITVYKADMSEFKEVNYDPDKDCFDEGYVCKDYLLYLDGRTYTFINSYGQFDKREIVIGR